MYSLTDVSTSDSPNKFVVKDNDILAGIGDPVSISVAGVTTGNGVRKLVLFGGSGIPKLSLGSISEPTLLDTTLPFASGTTAMRDVADFLENISSMFSPKLKYVRVTQRNNLSLKPSGSIDVLSSNAEGSTTTTKKSFSSAENPLNDSVGVYDFPIERVMDGMNAIVINIPESSTAFQFDISLFFDGLDAEFIAKKVA